MKLSELAQLTGAHIERQEDIEIHGAAGLDEAREGHVTFLANPRYTPRVNTTRASAIFLSEDAQTDRNIAILPAKDPYLAYTRALRVLDRKSTRLNSSHSQISYAVFCLKKKKKKKYQLKKKQNISESKLVV